MLTEKQLDYVKSIKSFSVELATENHTFEILGETNIELKIMDQMILVHFFVTRELRHPIILGYGWLSEQNAVLDTAQQIMYLGKRDRLRVPLKEHRDTREFIRPIRIDQVNNDVPPEYHNEFLNILNTFNKVFQPGTALPQTTTISHKIRLSDETPFRLPMYRYSEEKKNAFRCQVKEMRAANIIEPCDDEYISPIVMHTKKDGTYRFCPDLRRLNSVTIDAPHPMPIIHEELKEIGGATIFTTLDMESGYWQIPLSPESKKYTAFSTPEGGTYHFRVMPYGVKNASTTYQALMTQEVLTGLINKICKVYIDDIIIYSKNIHEHFQHLKIVLERLQIHGLTCSIKKCHFGKTEIKYLGYMIGQGENRPLPEHLHVIAEAAIPKNKKELMQFLGTCNWVREYIQNFSTIVAPLTELLKKNQRWKWNDTAQQAFQKLKEIGKEPLQLSRPDPNLTYVLQTDASAVGMGAVLYQTTPNNEKRIISFASAKFTPTQNRYSSNERECLAVVWATKRYRPWLEGAPFLLKTDNQAITWLHRMKDTRSKLLRWALLLQEFSFRVEHCPGRLNQLPDALSRNPACEEIEGDLDDAEKMLPPGPYAEEPQLNLIEKIEDNVFEAVQKSQQEDEEIAEMVQIRKRLEETATNSAAEEAILENYLVNDDGFWKKSQRRDNHWVLVVPTAMVPRVLNEFHDNALAGHPGREETFRSIGDHFHWETIRKDVEEYVKSCRLCACCKPRRTKKRDTIRPRQPKEPWETIALDLMGPYPRTGKGMENLLVITDIFSKWVEAFPLRTATATKIIELIESQIFARWGYPKVILSDNGPQFRSQEWKRAGVKWDVELWTTPIYHPRANPTERKNQDIKIGLRLRLEDLPHRQWDKKIPEILFNLRNRKNSATGTSPSEALLGRTLRRPGEWRLPRPVDEPHIQRHRQIKEHQKQYWGKRSQPPASEPLRYTPGTAVYVKTHPLSNAAQGFHAGMAPLADGPHVIASVVGENVYIVEKEGRSIKVHGNQLIPTKKRDEKMTIETDEKNIETAIPPSNESVPRKKKHPGRPRVGTRSRVIVNSQMTQSRYNLRPRKRVVK